MQSNTRKILTFLNKKKVKEWLITWWTTLKCVCVWEACEFQTREVPSFCSKRRCRRKTWRVLTPTRANDSSIALYTALWLIDSLTAPRSTLHFTLQRVQQTYTGDKTLTENLTIGLSLEPVLLELDVVEGFFQLGDVLHNGVEMLCTRPDIRRPCFTPSNTYTHMQKKIPLFACWSEFV